MSKGCIYSPLFLICCCDVKKAFDKCYPGLDIRLSFHLQEYFRKDTSISRILNPHVTLLFECIYHNVYSVYQIEVFGGTCLSVYSLQEASLVLDFISIEVYKTEWLLYIYE